MSFIIYTHNIYHVGWSKWVIGGGKKKILINFSPTFAGQGTICDIQSVKVDVMETRQNREDLIHRLRAKFNGGFL